MNGTGSRGFPWLEVTVESIDNGLADVVDQFGEHKSVRVDILRSKGDQPQVGERWIIDRAFGTWTFAAVIGYVPPEPPPPPDPPDPPEIMVVGALPYLSSVVVTGSLAGPLRIELPMQLRQWSMTILAKRPGVTTVATLWLGSGQQIGTTIQLNNNWPTQVVEEVEFDLAVGDLLYSTIGSYGPSYSATKDERLAIQTLGVLL